MNLLLDTHLLLWAAAEPQRLSPAARSLIEETSNVLFYSAASLWEVAINCGLDREDFAVDSRVLRRSLLDNGYLELTVAGEHAVAVQTMPPSTGIPSTGY